MCIRDSSHSIAPGKFEVLNVYIPAVRTAGRLKYKVYMDGYPENVFYEYQTLTAVSYTHL